MPVPDTDLLARFLATHALLLLGAGILAAVAAVAAVVAAVHLAARCRPLVLRGVTTLVARADEVPSLRRLLDRTTALVPSAYVAVHLAVGLVLVLAVGAFATLAEEVVETGGRVAAFDAAFARALYAQTSPAWLGAFATVSWLGSRNVLVAVTFVVALVLVARQQRVLALGWLGAQAGGALLNMALKQAFARTRPEFADPVLAASSWSFPSGHAMGTFIACGVGCYLLLRGGRSWLAASVVVTVAIAWCLVMAFSRLYLGVHYVSDVIAGLIAGAAWVAICVSAMEVVRRRTRPPQAGASR